MVCIRRFAAEPPGSFSSAAYTFVRRTFWRLHTSVSPSTARQRSPADTVDIHAANTKKIARMLL